MSDNFDLLQEAIARNTPVVLALPSAGITKSFRSRLLQITDEGILAESIVNQADAIDDLIRQKQSIHVAFRADTRRVEFEAKMLKRLRGHRLNAGTLVEAIVLEKPTRIKAVQRRSDYRVTVPGDCDIRFTVWRITEQADVMEVPPLTSTILIDIRDISAGGCGGTWRKRKDDPPNLADNQRLRVAVDSAHGQIILDARLKFLENLHEPDRKRVGIEFAINPTSIMDRQKTVAINKLLSELQRLELRRKKSAR